MIQTIEVENLKCNGCTKTIKNKLMSLKGVVNVIVNEENETVTVEGNTDRTLILAALSSIGYPEKGNNSLGKKMISYISCAAGRFSEN